METCLNWCGDRAFISTDDRGLIKRCLEGIEKYPDDCKIIALPEKNDGCLYFSCPVAFGKRAIRNLFPAQRKPLTEEERAAVAERLAAARTKQKEGGESDGASEVYS